MTMSYSFFWRKRSVSASPMMWLSLPTCEGRGRGHTTVRWRVSWEGGVHHPEGGAAGRGGGCAAHHLRLEVLDGRLGRADGLAHAHRLVLESVLVLVRLRVLDVLLDEGLLVARRGEGGG